MYYLDGYVVPWLQNTPQEQVRIGALRSRTMKEGWQRLAYNDSWPPDRRRYIAALGGKLNDPQGNLVFSYTVKKVIDFPVPSRDVTDQTLSGREFFNYSLSERV